MSLVIFATSLALTSSCLRAEPPQTAENAADPAPQPVAATPSEPAPSKPAQAESVTPEPAKFTTTQEIASQPASPAPIEVAQAPAKQPTAATTAAVEQTAAPAQKPVTKADIINSTEFRRAMFEFNEWLSGQQIYTPQEVAQIKDQFNHRVAEMNVQELVYLLADLEAKMQIINTPQSKEARAWMAQYLSVMSDKKRAQVLKDVPNVATMTAAQLSAEIAKIQETRETLDSEQASFQRGQAQQVANQIQTDRRNQQNYVNDWNTGPVSYSPYRNGSNVNERLNESRGGGIGYYVSPLGGVGMTFSPSSW
jgi:glutaredoxin-related protein